MDRRAHLEMEYAAIKRAWRVSEHGSSAMSQGPIAICAGGPKNINRGEARLDLSNDNAYPQRSSRDAEKNPPGGSTLTPGRWVVYE